LETARQRIDPSGPARGTGTDLGKVGVDGTWAGGRLRKCGRCLGPKPIVHSPVTQLIVTRDALLQLCSEHITVKSAAAAS
jgi:hypothetical protein